MNRINNYEKVVQKPLATYFMQKNKLSQTVKQKTPNQYLEIALQGTRPEHDTKKVAPPIIYSFGIFLLVHN